MTDKAEAEKYLNIIADLTETAKVLQQASTRIIG